LREKELFIMENLNIESFKGGKGEGYEPKNFYYKHILGFLGVGINF
jgi:hypothetical protein